MLRYLKNGIAFLRGFVLGIAWKASKTKAIGGKARVFGSADLDIETKGKISIGRGVKIRERAYINVRKGGKLEIGLMASVGMDCKIACHESVVIGEGTLLSPNVFIYDHDHVFSAETGVERKHFTTKPVVIGKNCWIGANTVILKGSRLGDRCLVGAGSVIKGEYPDGAVIIQKRETKVSL